MADLITLTATPVRVTSGAGGGGMSQLWSARDISAYNFLEIDVMIIGWEGASGSGLAQFRLMTGFQRESPTDWYVGASAAIPQGLSHMRFLVDGWQFRYLSWRCESLANASAATFWIRGMARYPNG